MILPDINLLVYAENSHSPFHDEANAWWQDLLKAEGQIALAWTTILGFYRLTTSPKVMKAPLSSPEATNRIDSWLAKTHISIALPGPDHAKILLDLLRRHDVAGGSVTDTHLAAIAIEKDWTLYSADRGFSRFEGLRWSNPILSDYE